MFRIDVSNDLEQTQQKLQMKEAEIEKYKVEARAVLDSVDVLYEKVNEARKHPSLVGV